ncbi:ANTAR domain-containing protein [Streptomyces griseorubiginosus]|uniref:ANTAR domain-containing protein n=1 Tax=Streptomyces griseorubiginosus TaxID=67304 RepID=UPI00215AA2DB|nr:ANTAR domain-containing protein [Streptomyces griseorubiginosus]
MPEPAHAAQPLTATDTRPPCLASVEAVTAGDRVRVICRGELDIGAEGLKPQLYDLLATSSTGVDLDLAGVGFCDCAGLNVLLDLRRKALDQGRTVTIASCGPALGRLLDLTGARELFRAQRVEGAESRPEAPDPVAADPEPGVDVDEELRLEVAQLRRAMRTRPSIDVARGIVMASFGLSSEDAWTVLVTASQNTNIKLRQLAEGLMGAVDGQPVAEDVRQQMARAVARVRETSSTPFAERGERAGGPTLGADAGAA